MPKITRVPVSALCVLGFCGILILALILNNSVTPSTDAILDIDNSETNIEWRRYSNYQINLEKTNQIVKDGVYHVTGELADSPLIVDAGKNANVKIILDNVKIENAEGPAIIAYAVDNLIIELRGENILSDGEKYAEKYGADVLGAIFVNGDLIFEGDGLLNLTAKNQDGIVSKDDLKIKSGGFYINAADDAIRGTDSVVIAGGELNLKARSDGIKSTNNTEYKKGFVLISDGHLKIESGDDAVHAENVLKITNGNIDIIKSYEGLEGSRVMIEGGKISVYSSDDGINASAENEVLISGGEIYINASGDGIDSNGNILITSTNLVIDGPANTKNSPLDSETEVIVKGGEIVALGTIGAANPSIKIEDQNLVQIYFENKISAGAKIELMDEEENLLLEHKPKKKYNYILISLPELKINKSYALSVDGKEVETFIIKESITKINYDHFVDKI